jgi:hypothetical protein
MMPKQQKQTVEEIKDEWKRLWTERRDDKTRAEGIATNDYNQLFIDRGTIIHATRDFKVLNLKDILKQHEIQNAERYIPPDKQTGGWNKFVKDNIHQPTKNKYQNQTQIKQPQNKQKANQRGWLHI